MKSAAFAFLLAPLVCSAAEPLFPTAEGFSWKYEMVQERPSETLDLDEPNKKEQFEVTYRLGGTEKIDNQELRRLEIYQGDSLESVDLIAIEENGIVCPARKDSGGQITKLIPPQKLLALPLKKGGTWNFDGTIGETKVSQHYEIAGEEDVDLPAGKFHAWRIHCEQTAPSPATIERWFVPTVGFVKVETAIKGESGGALQKTTLILKEPPKVVAAPPKTATSSPEKFWAGVSSEPTGELKAEIKSDTPAIYVRWRGHNLRNKAEIRAVLIAESVADVSADYQIDDSSTTAPTSNCSGTFTLSTPKDGWAPGNYRIEFFVDDELAQTVKFKISK
jgi:hypothetical protein